MASKFKQFTCPPNYKLIGGKLNPVCRCSKPSLCSSHTIAATPVSWTPGGSKGKRSGRGPGLVAGVGTLGGLDDLSDLGAQLGEDIPKIVDSVTGGAVNVIQAIKGKVVPQPKPGPMPKPDGGLPTWVVPTAIAAAVVFGGYALYKGLKKKK